MQDPFGEIVESSLTKITAQSWDVSINPSFGQCVQIQGESICVYALINHIQTGSLDTLRKPSPFKKTIAELKKEQPHIFEFLITTFTCVPIAYYSQQAFVYALPPEPPRIHEFVSSICPEKINLLFGNYHFLTTIFSLQEQITNIDELVLSCFRYIHQRTIFSSDYYIELLDTYALLIGNDYKRVKFFAKRLEEII